MIGGQAVDSQRRATPIGDKPDWLDKPDDEAATTMIDFDPTLLAGGAASLPDAFLDPTWAKLVRTLAVEFGQDGAFVLG
jgi:hypothetical protein